MPSAARSSRRSGGSGTGSGPDKFSAAALRVAAVYLALTALLVAGFSFVLYLNVLGNIEGNVEGNFATEAAQQAFVTRTQQTLRTGIVAADLGILVLVAVVAYLVARWSLRPVRRGVEMQRQFVSNASHELRTPLTILRTELEVAQRADRGTLDVERVLDDGLDEVGRMSRMVDDLLTLSRIDAQQETLAFADVDVAALVEHVAERMRVYAGRFGIAVSFETEGSAIVYADSERLERAVVNVVKNAIEHSPSGASVRLRVACEPSAVRIDVEDAGEGIAEEDLPHVFERFYRAKSSTFRARGGSGLGLSITRWIVERHHGTIRIDSTAGQGTIVTIRLPLSRASRSLHAGRVG